LIGFEELGNSDGFGTAVLELRLSKSGLSIFSGRLARVFNDAIGIINQQAESSSNPIYKIVLDKDDKVFDLDD